MPFGLDFGRWVVFGGGLDIPNAVLRLVMAACGLIRAVFSRSVRDPPKQLSATRKCMLADLQNAVVSECEVSFHGYIAKNNDCTHRVRCVKCSLIFESKRVRALVLSEAVFTAEQAIIECHLIRYASHAGRVFSVVLGEFSCTLGVPRCLVLWLIMFSGSF